MKSKIFKMLSSLYLNRIVKNKWVGKPKDKNLSIQEKFNSNEIQKILNNSWNVYFNKITRLPKQLNLGNWIVMNSAYLTFAAYFALINFGIEKSYAIELIQEITWHITSRGVKIANWFTKLFVQDKKRRLEFSVDLVMKFLFCPPTYKINKGELEKGFFMDVLKCPVAQFMAANDAGDLCVETWCGVDFGLVELIGGELIRTGTLAMGKKQCDFKFIIPS